MKNNHIIALLQTDYTTVQVVFPDGLSQKKLYTYKVPTAWNVQVEDTLVVDTPRNGLCLVSVVAVHTEANINTDVEWTYKWAVSRVDLAEYQDRLQREETANKLLLEIARIKAREQVVKDLEMFIGDDAGAKNKLTAVKQLLSGAPIDAAASETNS